MPNVPHPDRLSNVTRSLAPLGLSAASTNSLWKLCSLHTAPALIVPRSALTAALRACARLHSSINQMTARPANCSSSCKTEQLRPAEAFWFFSALFCLVNVLRQSSIRAAPTWHDDAVHPAISRYGTGACGRALHVGPHLKRDPPRH